MTIDQVVVWIIVGGVAGLLADALVKGIRVGLVSAHIIYTPPLDFLGTDVFTYTASTDGESATATVMVLVVSEVFRVSLPLIRR